MKKNISAITLLFLSLFIWQSVSARCVVCYTENSKWHCFVMKGKCVTEGCSYASDYWGCCKDLSFVSNIPPVIRVLKNGTAFLVNGRQITQLASDKFVTFISKKNKLTNKELVTFFKTDNGIVSRKSLAAFAKDLNATIVKSSKPIKANYCPACEDEKVKAASGKKQS